ncbi:MAG: hypothetical protein AAF513_14950 [Pseudomonadota bacterium]
MSRDRRYSGDEVSQIVREALQLRNSEQANSHSYEDLQEIARQCGVDDETLAKAVEVRELQDKKIAIRQRWRQKALSSLLWPVVLCGAFVLFNINSGGFPWAIFPIIFWLLPALSRSRSRLFPSDDQLTKAARKLAAAAS